MTKEAQTGGGGGCVCVCACVNDCENTCMRECVCKSGRVKVCCGMRMDDRK